MTLELISQIIIPVTSGISIWAFAGHKYRKVGFMLGLCSQPFWFYTTYINGQWGMFIISFWFAGNHVRGLYNCRK